MLTVKNHCLENGKKVFLNPAFADVHFWFGEKDNIVGRIPANKIILATESTVFQAMFYGELREPGDVHVTDSTEAAFMVFLQYFYLKRVKLPIKHVADVLHLGDKYDVKKCVNDCIELLLRTMDNENVCYYLGLAILYDRDDLMDACKKHIIVNTEAVLQSVSFLEYDRRVIGYILKIEMLSCYEEDVFRACMAWVQAKSKCAEVTLELVHEHLGELYYEIRVASFSMDKLLELEEEFAKVIARDCTNICFLIALPECNVKTKFKKTQRKTVFNRDLIVVIERIVDNDAFERDLVRNYELTTFRIGTAAVLGALSFAEIFTGPEDDPMDCTVTVSLEIKEIDCTTNQVLKCLTTTQIELDSEGSTVELPEPLLLRPNFAYIIELGPFPSYHRMISRPLQRMYHDCSLQILDESSPLIKAFTFNVI